MSEKAKVDYEGTVLDSLGVRQLEMTKDRVVFEVDIGPRVHQPMGILHGGVSAVLAESAASMGAYMSCDPESEFAVGIDLNISHLKSKREGLLRATATPIRRGRTVHVWNVDLTDERDEMVAKARVTVLIRSWDSQKGA